MGALTILRALDSLQIVLPEVRARSTTPPPWGMAQCWESSWQGRAFAKIGADVHGSIYVVDERERKTVIEPIEGSASELAAMLASLAGDLKRSAAAVD